MSSSGQPPKTTLNCCFIRVKKNVKNNCGFGMKDVMEGKCKRKMLKKVSDESRGTSIYSFFVFPMCHMCPMRSSLLFTFLSFPTRSVLFALEPLSLVETTIGPNHPPVTLPFVVDKLPIIFFLVRPAHHSFPLALVLNPIASVLLLVRVDHFSLSMHSSMFK